jgi:hypothetical protein
VVKLQEVKIDESVDSIRITCADGGRVLIVVSERISRIEEEDGRDR